MQKFSSLFKEDGEGGAAPADPTTPSNVSGDMATTGLQQKVTHDDLRKKRELEETSFSKIFSKTFNKAFNRPQTKN